MSEPATIIRPILFVDFDGVLVTPAYQMQRGSADKLDPEKVELLNRICYETNAQIVVTSSWRGSWAGMTTFLERQGLKCAHDRVIGVTPRLRDQPRGDEIAHWLFHHGRGNPICILDDDADMGELTPYLLRTDPREGLQEHHIPIIIAIIKGGLLPEW